MEEGQELGRVFEMLQGPTVADGDRLRLFEGPLEIGNFGMVALNGSCLVIPDDGAPFATEHPVGYGDDVSGHGSGPIPEQEARQQVRHQSSNGS